MIENNLFQSLFDVLPFGVYVTDIETHEIIYMNICMRERVGEQFQIGSRCWEAIYRQEERCSFCRSDKLLDADGFPNGHTEIFEHFDDASDCWYQLQEKAMTWPDGRIVTYSIAVDVTQFKEVQNRLAEAHAELSLKAREVEAAERAKGAFLATMSHELRSPLNSILGFSNLLGTDPSLGEKQQQQARMIEQSGTHLLSLINDVLDIEKIAAGRMELNPAPFALKELLAAAVGVMEMRAREKGIELLLHPLDTVPDQVEGDAMRLNQVLLNLLSNAVKFTQKGRVKLMAAWRIGKLHIAVSDTGAGISLADRAKLFQPFVQVGDVNKHREGSGLGLSIARQIVEKMGGRLELESALGRGSRFFFTIPMSKIEDPEWPTEQPEQPSVAPLKGCRVLVVEDNRVNQEMVLGFLEAAGVEVTVVADGPAAIKAVSAGDYELVLMDVFMPEMDGCEATREIRKIAAKEKLCIIAFTADTTRETYLRCLEAGMDDLLTKPVSPENLYGCMMRWLGKEQPCRDGGPQSDDQPRFDEDDVPLIESTTVLELFTLHYRGYAERIRNALTGEDQKSVFLLTHTLKGAAGTIGAMRLSRMVAELEALTNQGTGSEEIGSKINGIEVEIDRLIEQIERLLASSA